MESTKQERETLTCPTLVSPSLWQSHHSTLRRTPLLFTCLYCGVDSQRGRRPSPAKPRRRDPDYGTLAGGSVGRPLFPGPPSDAGPRARVERRTLRACLHLWGSAGAYSRLCFVLSLCPSQLMYRKRRSFAPGGGASFSLKPLPPGAN